MLSKHGPIKTGLEVGSVGIFVIKEINCLTALNRNTKLKIQNYPRSNSAGGTTACLEEFKGFDINSSGFI